MIICKLYKTFTIGQGIKEREISKVLFENSISWNKTYGLAGPSVIL